MKAFSKYFNSNLQFVKTKDIFTSSTNIKCSISV